MARLPKILIVDDHREIRESVSRYLGRHGLKTAVAKDAREMDVALDTGRFDMVVLDIMMPGEDGLSACSRVTRDRGLPVLLLTALGEDDQRIAGLDIGADDYLPKPFNPRELVARINAILRRVEREEAPSPIDGKTVCFAHLRFEAGSGRLSTVGGAAIDLTATDRNLLTVFLERAGRVLTRDQLLDLTAGRSAGPLDRTVDNQVSRLRRKVEIDPRKPKIITTVRSGGYRLNSEIEIVD